MSRILVSSEARGLDFSPACPDELGRELRTELDVMEPDVMEPNVMEPDSTELDRKSTLGVYAGGSSPFTPFHWSFVTVFLSLNCSVRQKQEFVADGKYPHVVYVEKPKDQDVDFSDAMIYQAQSTSEMEGKLLSPSPLPM